MIADGELLVMTPIDPSFLLIPLLLAVRPTDNSAGMFRPLDEVFDGVPEKLESVTPEDVATLINLDCVAGAMRRICDVQGKSMIFPFACLRGLTLDNRCYTRSGSVPILGEQALGISPEEDSQASKTARQ